MPLPPVMRTLPRLPIRLMFDVNQTTWMIDPAGDKSQVDILNGSIAGETFGTVADGKWSLVEGPSFPSRPPTVGTVSYADYIDDSNPFPTGLKEEEREKAMKLVNTARRAAKKSFTLPGQPGEAFADLVEVQRKALGYAGENGSPWRIIPSFFHCLNELSMEEWSFSVIFRTFGSDLPDVLREWKAFVEGKHEVKPQGPILASMKNAAVRTFAVHRDDASLWIVDDRRAPLPLRPPGESAAAYLRRCAETARCAKVSDVKISESVGGVVDDYFYWNHHGQIAEAGKIVPIDMESPPKTFQVMFDDNMNFEGRESIVDFRRADSGEPLERNERRAFGCRTRVLYAITQMDYFLEELATRCLQQWKA